MLRQSNKRDAPFIQQLLLALLFAGLLSISFLDSNYFYLTWLAFVPLLFAIENSSLLKTYIIGLIGGFACYLSGMYWIIDFITISKGYSLSKSILIATIYWFYCAHLIALLVLLFKWLRLRTRLHEFLLFPLLTATFTSCFPMLFSMRLGESQIKFQSALQAIEFTGVHGLDFIIALFNILTFRFLYRRIANKARTSTPTKWPWFISISLISTWFLFGIFQHSIWLNKELTWETLNVGIVQPNEAPKLDNTPIYPGYSYAYPPEMEMTERLASLGAELVVWPEAQAKQYLNNSKVKLAFQKVIKDLGSNLLFQDMQHNRNPIDGKLVDQTNTAILIDETGKQHLPYIKIKRIPFGEYVPLTNENSLIKNWVKGIFGDFLIETTKGDTHRVFNHKKVNIIPLICYETTSPSFVGRAVKASMSSAFNEGSLSAEGSKNAKGSIIIALSNDGWFGSTHQPYQHIMPSVLRAIENRLPLIHVANNGPSIAVTPSGSVVFTSDFQKAGGYIAKVPYSKSAQGSFYSKHPSLFDNTLYLLSLLILIFSLIKTPVINKRR